MNSAKHWRAGQTVPGNPPPGLSARRMRGSLPPCHQNPPVSALSGSVSHDSFSDVAGHTILQIFHPAEQSRRLLRLFRIKKHMLQRPMLPGPVQGNINFLGCQNLLHADGNAQFRHTHQVPPLIAEFFLRCPGMNRCCRASADDSRTWARIRRIVVNNLRKYFLFYEEIWRQSFIQSSNNRH